MARLTKCSCCGGDVSSRAWFCPSCGHPVSSREWTDTDKAVAAVLTVIVPGGGHVYKKQFGQAFLWFCGVLLGYALLLVPGLVLHGFCVLSAMKAPEWAERG